ncbi:MAG: hypothetical protein M1350_07225, partial [Actinobacteria bacterium]|nr:hypothetical protein [Actinomycetota bacterium]
MSFTGHSTSSGWKLDRATSAVDETYEKETMVSDRASAPAGYEAELERLNRETVTLTKGMQAAIAV